MTSYFLNKDVEHEYRQYNLNQIANLKKQHKEEIRILKEDFKCKLFMINKTLSIRNDTIDNYEKLFETLFPNEDRQEFFKRYLDK